jgi:hypothetical protein
MTDLDRLPPPSQPPLGYHLAPVGPAPLSAGGWTLLVLALVFSVAVQLGGYQVAQLFFSSCGTPTADDPTHVLGQGAVLIGAALTFGAWWLAAHLTHYRSPVLAAMFVSTLVGALVVIDALTLTAWSQGWCF